MELIRAIKNLSEEMASALSPLSDEQYAQPVTSLNNASIGQHVRHVLELFQELQAGYDSGTVNYDQRRRDYRLSEDKTLACIHLATLPEACAKENRELLLAGNFGMETTQTIVATNYYRELIYNLEHTVHHMALIRGALQQFLPHPLPEGFGIAASTKRHQRACAQ